MEENENKVTLKLFATLSKYASHAGDTVTIQPGTTVRELISRFDIPEKEAKLVFIDSVKSSLDQELKGGERVGIFPPIGGG
jgi:molybdopterin converting factor small subunit